MYGVLRLVILLGGVSGLVLSLGWMLTVAWFCFWIFL